MFGIDCVADDKRRNEDMAGRTPDFEPHDGLDALASRYVDIDAIPWRETRPGMRMKVLFKDDEARQATILIEATTDSF